MATTIDSPRIVLDRTGDFEILNSTPARRFKLHELEEFCRNSRLGGGVLAVRPIPRPAAVAHATEAMSTGQPGVWSGTCFTCAVPDTIDGPDELLKLCPVNTSCYGVFEKRWCLQRQHVPALGSLKTMFIYTDGACSNNGSTTETPRGGYAFVWKPDGVSKGALEDRCVTGNFVAHTSNRAELRAVIGALEYRRWAGEGWEKLVIITDSEYVAKGATRWIKSWAVRGWRTSSGTRVANKDLWEMLSRKLGDYAHDGCEVSFWALPREWNVQADRAAKQASTLAPVDKFNTVHGILGTTTAMEEAGGFVPVRTVRA